jgi:Vacuolar sorting-associated protein 13, N-terminal/N-terminal region of Chorein or VPS13/Repeating coiled region of VPS13
MAKKALLDVLEQTIGKYVRNLDAESLNVAVWSGQMELSALELDADAVNAALALALPFRVVSGAFAHLQVEVPWAQLMSRSVVLRATGLTVVVEPHHRATTTVEEEEEARDASLARADQYRRQSNALLDLAEQELKTNDTFASRLMRRVLENIQIEISSVAVSVQGAEGAACGVTLDALSLVTTDSLGKQTFVDRSVNAGNEEHSFLYKVLRIAGLGVYVDDDDVRKRQNTRRHLATIGEMDVEDGSEHSYVLVPLSWEAQLRQADSNICLDHPKYWLASEIPDISVLLNKTQLESAYRLMEQLQPSSFHILQPLFPEYRPMQRVTKETAVLWWKYAVRCIGRLNGRRSWVEFFRAFQLRKQYIPLYKRGAHHEQCPWLKELLVWEVALLRSIETDRSISVDGIMAWRNSADAQVKKEQEKHDASQAAKAAKTSIFSSLFGSSSSAPRTDDAPPIALTAEELNALEHSVQAAVNLELSSDSRLCDFRFVLGSLRIDLSSNDRPLSALEMGTVATSFQANQDGSYAFDLSLTSLDVHDRCTLHTFFPTILTNPRGSEAEQQVMKISCSKSKQGDQRIFMSLKTFEAVVSPTWLMQLKHFVTLSQHRPSANTTSNPLLAQSLSGSIDLFYDATEGSDKRIPSASNEFHVDAPVSSAAGAMEDWSHTLVAAWQAKGETQASWVVDLDLQAPILVVPESCLSPRANVLVFDLGHFRFQYGTPASASVAQWYQENRHPERRVVLQLEHGSIRISSLTFSLGKVNYWRRMVRKHEAHNRLEEDDEHIIEPISVSVDFGIESLLDHAPRVCAMGVVPAIALRWSPKQLSRIMHVVKAWKNTLKDVIPESSADTVDLKGDSLDILSSPLRGASNVISEAVESSSPNSISVSSVHEQLPVLFAEIRLQKLSIRVLDEGENGLEAHLISVSLSSVSYENGSSNSILSMGWFWIMDRFVYDFPRMQRLVAHSTLPIGTEDASAGPPDILNILKQHGVFDDNFKGSGELALISFCQAASGTNFGTLDPFSVDDHPVGMDLAVASKLEAHFSRLFIHWNPRAVKTMMSMISTILKSISSVDMEQDHQLIVSSPSQLARRRRFSFDSMTKTSKVETSSILVVANMDGLQVSLNSALDDLPLFTGTMSSTRLTFVATSDSSSRLALSVGDLKLDSASMGRTHSSYSTILGLASGQSDALLSVRYYTGSKALASSSSFNNLGLSNFEAFGEIDLSPMKMVYIQAQILAIVEYATAGILGVLTANAAASAAQVATEIATSNDSAKKVIVRAKSLELILPRAAYLADHISASVGSMFVDFSMMPDASAMASISIRKLFLMSASFENLLEEPVQMDVSVLLPPEAVGSMDDQAFKVGIAITKANFILTKPQYAQLLATLDENIGEQDLFLREQSTPLSQVADNAILSDGDIVTAMFTHAGAEVVDNPRRIYLNFSLESLALSLCALSQDQPLLRVTARNASFDLKLLVDISKMVTLVTLKDLSCDDERVKALSRQYRSLIYQANAQRNVGVEDDVFFASYETSEGSSSAELKIGSPRIVFIPDVVSEVLEFLSVDRRSPRSDQIVSKNVSYQEVVAVNADDADISGIEANFVREVKSSISFSISIKTDQCSLLLVDLGSESLLLNQGGLSLPSTSVAETVVMSGIFDISASIDSDAEANEVTRMQSELHGSQIEVYTAFGRELASAVQVLDPTVFAVYVNFSLLDGNKQKLDIRCAALSPIDMTLSMQNVALLNAILNSVSDCFDSSDSVVDSKLHSLNEEEANRVKHLAQALETESLDTSIHSQVSTRVESAVSDNPSQLFNETERSGEASFKLTTPECKFVIINDLQGLDEALVRVTFRNIVASGYIQNGEGNNTDSPPFTGFDFSFHTSVLSDYFDASKNIWKVLLLQPWEISSKGSRGTSRRFESSRPSTTIDIDSLPCHLSFSEQFLMSLASTNRMWSVYSLASESAVSSVDQLSQKNMSLRRSMVASAARTFISSLPYAVENHCGVSVELQINDNDKTRRFCQSGSIEYFRFEPPVTNGTTGGKRLYGQDISFEKKISLFVGSHCINLSHLDSLVGLPRATHRLDSEGFIATDVVKEGKSIVSYEISARRLRCCKIPHSFSFRLFPGCSRIKWN